jgi:hypothetical protein
VGPPRLKPADRPDTPGVYFAKVDAAPQLTIARDFREVTGDKVLSIAGDSAHRMTWGCMQLLCINSGEGQYVPCLGGGS